MEKACAFGISGYRLTSDGRSFTRSASPRIAKSLLVNGARFHTRLSPEETKENFKENYTEFVCLRLEFKGLVNIVTVMLSRSVDLLTLFLGRLSPLRDNKYMYSSIFLRQ